MEIYTSALPVSGKAVHKNHIMNTFASATVKIGRVKRGGGIGRCITESNKSRATTIILKSLGSDNQSAQIDGLKWVANRVYNKK